MRLRGLIVAVMLAAFLGVTSTASAAPRVEHPSKQPPAWFTKKFKKKVDRAGKRGKPKDEPSILDVCPGVHPHNGAIATPGVGPAIVRIGTVSKRVERYRDGGVVEDFASIKIANGLRVEPNSPVGGPQGIYDGCEAGQPLKFWGNGYEVAVAQGNPGGGVSAHWYDSGFGWVGDAFGGDSGSGVMHADNRAAGDLTAVYIFDPSLAFAPGEVVGTRVTWILRHLGSRYHLVNADHSLS